MSFPRFGPALPYEHGPGHLSHPRAALFSVPHAAPHPPRPNNGLFTGSLWEQAQKLANFSYAPYASQYQSLLGSMNTQDAQTLQQLRDYIASVAQGLAGVAPQVQQAYENAAHDQAAFAQGFSDAVRGSVQQSADQSNATLASIGAPAGQQIAPGQAAGAGDVTYGLGGYIPATSLAGQGAHAYAEAAQLPSIVEQRGLGVVSNLLGQQQTDRRQFQAQYLQALAGKPQATLSAYGQLQSQRAANAKLNQPTYHGDSKTGIYAVFPNGRRVLAVPPAPTLAKIHYYTDGQGVVHAVNESTGATTALPGPPKLGTVVRPWAAPNGDVYTWNPKARSWAYGGNAAKPQPLKLVGSSTTGWKLVDPITGQPVTSFSGTGPKPVIHYDAATGLSTAVDPSTGKVIWKQQTGTATPPKPAAATQPKFYSSGAAWIPQKDGSWKYIPSPPKPGQPALTDPATGIALSKTQVADYTQTVRLTIYGSKTKPRTPSGMRPLGTVIDAVTHEGIPEKLWVPIVMKAYNIPSAVKDVKFMALPRLRNFAIFLGWRPDPAHPLDRAGFVQWITANLPRASGAETHVHPAPGASAVRVDQGVDFASTSPYLAVGSGKVIRIAQNALTGGTGEIVVIQLDAPATWHGRTYDQVYYGEEHPLVTLGQRVTAGMPVMAAGGAELGFARDGRVAAPLVGGLGAKTQPTQAGYDFLNYINSVRGSQATTSRQSSVPPGGPVRPPAPPRRPVRRTQSYSPSTASASSQATSAKQLSTHLKAHGSPFAGLGGYIYQQGAKYGVDPRLIVAIAGAETTYGTYGPSQRIHNPFGMGPGRNYATWKDAIAAAARTLGENYIGQGLTTVEAVSRKWAPVGAANDPNGLNRHWIDNVSAILRQLGGDPNALEFGVTV